MKILKKEKSGSVVLEVQGRLETGTAPELEAELNVVLPTTSSLVLDFAKLEYVSSAGLRVLLTAQKYMNAHNGKLKITNVNDVIKEVFDITGFSSILNIA